MNSAFSSHCDNLDRAVGRLKLISSHDALIILRNCLSTLVNFTLRASPCTGHSSLTKFDDILRKAICSIVNVNLSDDQWLQASLPVRLGGLGVRSVSSLAPSAFLASAPGTTAAGTSDLQDSILSQIALHTDPNVTRAHVMWSKLLQTLHLVGYNGSKAEGLG